MQGHGPAAANLGLCFANGNGVQQSYSDAVRWLNFAKEKDVLQAQGAIDDILKRASAARAPGASGAKATLLRSAAAVAVAVLLAVVCARGF